MTDQPAAGGRAQSSGPLPEAVVVEVGEQQIQVHDLIASQETKLKALKQQ